MISLRNHSFSSLKDIFEQLLQAFGVLQPLQFVQLFLFIDLNNINKDKITRIIVINISIISPLNN